MPKVKITDKKGLVQSKGSGVTISPKASIPKMHGAIQRHTADAAFTIGNDKSLVDIAVDPASSRIVTLPAAEAGRHFKVIWSVEQATNDYVFTCAGSDKLGGTVIGHVEGNAAGDGDALACPLTSTALTTVDDVNIGSFLEWYCASDGQWLVTGHLVIGAIGSMPTVA